MKHKITVLGAGFGGMELTTILSETFGDAIEVTLIDNADAFIFGYSKLDVMFGSKTLDEVRVPYDGFVKPGVRLLRETVTAIDPVTRRVTTDAGTHDCDFLVVALGADYDYAATPGLLEAGNEFYSVEGAETLRQVLPTFTKGHALIGVAHAPFKCPPAPSECALMLHDFLERRGVRDQCSITLVMPLSSPVPPSPPTAAALLAAFAERGITFIPLRKFVSLDGARKVALLDDGTEMPYDLFLGVPRNRAPAVVDAAGMADETGWVPVNPRTLETRWAGVYAVGDIAGTGTPKAGIFAEGQARAVAQSIGDQIRGADASGRYPGLGTCYIEFGGGRVARVDVDFFSGPTPVGLYNEPTVELHQDKERFGATRRARWFGL